MEAVMKYTELMSRPFISPTTYSFERLESDISGNVLYMISWPDNTSADVQKEELVPAVKSFQHIYGDLPRFFVKIKDEPLERLARENPGYVPTRVADGVLMVKKSQL